MSTEFIPRIIQGGMGVAVSGWRLARAVSMEGQLGVVSGTALDVVLARRLQQGDPGGDIRRAMAMFPFEEMVAPILDKYFIEGGKPEGKPFKSVSLFGLDSNHERIALLVVSNFVEVFLAKEGHDGHVGVNLLEKIQMPTLPALFGAMLAEVDYVLMGAGIPRTIPGILDSLAAGDPVELRLAVEGADKDEKFFARFDSGEFAGGRIPWLTRPKFLAIVASTTLAIMLSRKSTGKVDGFIIEGPTAGGHNAPPRGALQISSRGEPVYGSRDEVDLNTFKKIGLPFWLAGSYGTPEKVEEAVAAGAAGVQIGTAFAFCDESGMGKAIRRRAIHESRLGEIDVFTDPNASPTGFPFKVYQIEGTVSQKEVYEKRDRVCDLGYLRHAYKKENGTIGWRCPSEPVHLFTKKGGDESHTAGRKCVCNGLFANIGVAQVRKDSRVEEIMVTCGDDLKGICKYLPTPNATTYSAKMVLDYLLGKTTVRELAEVAVGQV